MRYWPALLTTPSLHWWLVPLLAIAAGQCLAAIWAASGRRHWFWRLAAVWAALALLVPIRAYEPAWLFALSSTLIIVALTVARWWDWRSRASESLSASRWRFALSDLLLLLLFIGMALALGIEVFRAYRPTNWLGWLTSAGALAILSVLAHACVAGPRRRWAIVGLILGVPACAALAWCGGDLLRVWEIAGVWNSFPEDVVSLSIVGFEFVLVLMATLALTRALVSAGSA